MDLVVLLLKMAFLLLSIFGIMCLYKLKFDIDNAFLPFISVTSIITVMLLGGLLNLLNETVYLLYFIGFFGAIIYIYKLFTKKEKWDMVLSPQLLLYFALCLFRMIFFKDILFHISDEFSHWGTIMKEMCTVSGLPDARTVIEYKEYPPAAALFGYYFLKLTGFSESICYMAQAIFAFSCLIPWTYDVKWKNIWKVAFSIVGAIIMLSISDAYITSLLVDYLMPVTAVALTIFALENRNMLVENPVKFLLLSLPITVVLTFIKTNGVVLYVMYIIVLTYLFVGNSSDKRYSRKEIYNSSLILLSPIALMLLWKKYIDKVYLGDGYATVKFALTKDNLLKNFQEKPIALRKQIFYDLLKLMFTSKLFLVVVCCIVAVCVILTVDKDRLSKNAKDLKFFSLFSILSWFTYLTGYGIMLVFLMPKWEFDSYGYTMIGFSRYVGVIAGYVIGLLLYSIFKVLIFSNYENKKVFNVRYLLAVALVVVSIAVGQVSVGRCFEYEINEQYLYMHEFDARLQKVYSRNDKLFFYTGEYVDDKSYYNDFELKNIFLNRNITNFSNYTIEGLPYDYDDGALVAHLRENNYLVKLIDDDELENILTVNDIKFDDLSGVMFKITYDFDTQTIFLSRVQ